LANFDNENKLDFRLLLAEARPPLLNLAFLDLLIRRPMPIKKTISSLLLKKVPMPYPTLPQENMKV